MKNLHRLLQRPFFLFASCFLLIADASAQICSTLDIKPVAMQSPLTGWALDSSGNTFFSTPYSIEISPPFTGSTAPTALHTGTDVRLHGLYSEAGNSILIGAFSERDLTSPGMTSSVKLFHFVHPTAAPIVTVLANTATIGQSITIERGNVSQGIFSWVQRAFNSGPNTTTTQVYACNVSPHGVPGIPDCVTGASLFAQHQSTFPSVGARLVRSVGYNDSTGSGIIFQEVMANGTSNIWKRISASGAAQLIYTAPPATFAPGQPSIDLEGVLASGTVAVIDSANTLAPRLLAINVHTGQVRRLSAPVSASTSNTQYSLATDPNAAPMRFAYRHNGYQLRYSDGQTSAEIFPGVVTLTSHHAMKSNVVSSYSSFQNLNFIVTSLCH